MLQIGIRPGFGCLSPKDREFDEKVATWPSEVRESGHMWLAATSRFARHFYR